MQNSSVADLAKLKSPLVNAWLTIPSAWTAEMIASCGFDILTVDLQHGLIGYETAIWMLQTISQSGVQPMARVSWKESGQIMGLLDAGARGIVCPMINSREEAREFAQACLYPPKGFRSFGPIRGLVGDANRDIRTSNSQITSLAMIETVEAVKNLDEILSVDELSGVYIGAVDLSIDMGFESNVDFKNAKLRNSIEIIVSKARKKKKLSGIHIQSKAVALELAEFGFDIITTVNDSYLLKESAAVRSNEILSTVKANSL